MTREWEGSEDTVNELKTVRSKGSERPRPLFTTKWRRIVIDEAQNIRNRKTQVSKASTHLQAKYRWCLTGTPITNTLTDTYSLLRFLRIGPFDNWKKWGEEVHTQEKKDPQVASKRVQLILRDIMLRRHKDSTLNGKRLLNLLPMVVREVEVFLDADQQYVHDWLLGETQQQINKYIRERTVMKNTAHIFALLQRLRQW